MNKEPEKPRRAIWQVMAQNLHFLNEGTPQAKALGINISEITEARAKGELPWRQDITGDQTSGTIASGAVVTLIDQVCGASCMAALTKPAGMATLDLRIDYMRPARKGNTIRAEGHCYRVTHQIAFVRANAYDGDDEGDIVAAVQGTFMIIENRAMGAKPESNSGEKPALPTITPKVHGGPIHASTHQMADEDLGSALKVLCAQTPYLSHIGFVYEIDGGELKTHLPFKHELIGNPMLPALHGGVIAAAMEFTAIGELMAKVGTKHLPKTIDMSIDYLRSGKPETTFTSAKIVKIGRWVANVEVIAWQSDKDKPIAKLHGHFLLASPSPELS